jgi:hypothetical protein
MRRAEASNASASLARARDELRNPGLPWLAKKKTLCEFELELIHLKSRVPYRALSLTRLRRLCERENYSVFFLFQHCCFPSALLCRKEWIKEGWREDEATKVEVNGFFWNLEQSRMFFMRPEYFGSILWMQREKLEISSNFPVQELFHLPKWSPSCQPLSTWCTKIGLLDFLG